MVGLRVQRHRDEYRFRQGWNDDGERCFGLLQQFRTLFPADALAQCQLQRQERVDGCYVLRTGQLRQYGSSGLWFHDGQRPEGDCSCDWRQSCGWRDEACSYRWTQWRHWHGNGIGQFDGCRCYDNKAPLCIRDGSHHGERDDEDPHSRISGRQGQGNLQTQWNADAFQRLPDRLAPRRCCAACSFQYRVFKVFVNRRQRHARLPARHQRYVDGWCNGGSCRGISLQFAVWCCDARPCFRKRKLRCNGCLDADGAWPGCRHAECTESEYERNALEGWFLGCVGCNQPDGKLRLRVVDAY